MKIFLNTLTGSVVLFLLFSAQLTNSNETKTYFGEAYSLEDNKFLYREEHVLEYVDGSIAKRKVNYLDSTGELIVTKENKYLGLSHQPSYQLVDLRRAYEEQAVVGQEKIKLVLNEKGKKTIEQKSVDVSNLVVDAGFDHFIQLSWQDLINGKTIEFNFASVARQTIVEFELIPVRKDDDKLYLNMELASSWLAWLIPTIELEYDIKTKKLLRYKGLSNIQDKHGDGLYVDLKFYY